MKRVDTAILLAHAIGAFATDTGIFKVEETPYGLNTDRVAEVGHYSTLERAIKEVAAETEDGVLMADEGENPSTGEIEPYVHFVDLEDLMISVMELENRPSLIMVGEFDDGSPNMTYRISFIKLNDEDEPGI